MRREHSGSKHGTKIISNTRIVIVLVHEIRVIEHPVTANASYISALETMHEYTFTCWKLWFDSRTWMATKLWFDVVHWRADGDSFVYKIWINCICLRFWPVWPVTNWRSYKVHIIREFNPLRCRFMTGSLNWNHSSTLDLFFRSQNSKLVGWKSLCYAFIFRFLMQNYKKRRKFSKSVGCMHFFFIIWFE